MTHFIIVIIYKISLLRHDRAHNIFLSNLLLDTCIVKVYQVCIVKVYVLFFQGLYPFNNPLLFESYKSPYCNP